MNELTVITTYYNNKDLLENFIKNFLLICKDIPFLQLIIVDDGSMVYPAIDVVKKFDTDKISLYRIKDDIGFNSHGARNLGMTVSKTDWNLLTDSDVDPLVYNIENFVDMDIEWNDVYSFTTNSILIHKNAFFQSKGYDEEFTNLHYGDTYFLKYLKRNFKYIELKKQIKKLRLAWRVHYSRTHNITTYDEETRILYQPILPREQLNLKEVHRRYREGDFSSKKILNFEWEQLI